MIISQDFSESKHAEVERVTFQNLIPALQIEDLAFQTGYVDEVYKFYATREANTFAIWHFINLMMPLVTLLDAMSMECHRIETTVPDRTQNYPSIPYYGEIFTFVYIPKKSVLKKKSGQPTLIYN